MSAQYCRGELGLVFLKVGVNQDSFLRLSEVHTNNLNGVSVKIPHSALSLSQGCQARKVILDTAEPASPAVGLSANRPVQCHALSKLGTH